MAHSNTINLCSGKQSNILIKGGRVYAVGFADGRMTSVRY